MDPLAQAPQQFGFGAAGGSSGVTVLNPPGGTANTIPKWSGATSQTNSALTDDGTSFTVTNRQSTFVVDDAFRVAVVDILSLVHTTSDPAFGGNGIGVGMAFIAEDSIGTAESIGRINALFTNATSGAEASAIDFYTRTGGANPLTVLRLTNATWVFGAGDATATTTALTIRGAQRTGADAAAAKLTFQGPGGTGTNGGGGVAAGAGQVLIQTVVPTATSSTALAYASRFAVGGGSAVTAGGVMIGAYAVATAGDPGDGNLTLATNSTSGIINFGNLAARLIAGSNIVYLQALVSSAITQLNFEVATTTGATIDRFRSHAYGGVMSAGNLASWGDGGSFVEMMALTNAGHLRLRNLGQFQGLYSGSYYNLISVNASAMVTVGTTATTELTLASGGITRFNSTGIDWRFMTNSFVYVGITDGVTQWGKNDASATPADWIHRGANVVAGTAAIRGGKITFTNGLGTGNAVAGAGLFFTVADATTGTLQQTASLKLTIASLSIAATVPVLPGTYTVALLPAGTNGWYTYASDGRSGIEGAGLGTGVPVVFSNGQWRRLEDMAIVAA